MQFSATVLENYVRNYLLAIIDASLASKELYTYTIPFQTSGSISSKTVGIVFG